MTRPNKIGRANRGYASPLHRAQVGTGIPACPLAGRPKRRESGSRTGEASLPVLWPVGQSEGSPGVEQDRHPCLSCWPVGQCENGSEGQTGPTVWPVGQATGKDACRYFFLTRGYMELALQQTEPVSQHKPESAFAGLATYQRPADAEEPPRQLWRD